MDGCPGSSGHLSIDEALDVGSGGAGVQLEGVAGEAGAGVAGNLGALGRVLGEVAGDGQAGDAVLVAIGHGADVEFAAPGDEPSFAVRAVGVGAGADGDVSGGLADGVLEVGGGEAGRGRDEGGGVLAAGAVEAEQDVEVDGAACLVLGGLAVRQAGRGQPFGRPGEVRGTSEGDEVAFDVLLGVPP